MRFSLSRSKKAADPAKNAKREKREKRVQFVAPPFETFIADDYDRKGNLYQMPEDKWEEKRTKAGETYYINVGTQRILWGETLPASVLEMSNEEEDALMARCGNCRQCVWLNEMSDHDCSGMNESESDDEEEEGAANQVHDESGEATIAELAEGAAEEKERQLSDGNPDHDAGEDEDDRDGEAGVEGGEAGGGGEDEKQSDNLDTWASEVSALHKATTTFNTVDALLCCSAARMPT